MKTKCVKNSFLTTYFIPALAISMMLFLNGCASTKINQDYREGTDFSQFKTYTWRNTSSEIPGVNSQQLKRLADNQLQSQGYTLATDADLILDMTLVTRVTTGSSTGVGVSIGLPIGRMGSVGLGGGKTLPNDKQEGVILIDITHQQTNNLVWRGSAEGIPIKDFSLSGEDKLALVLAKLLSQFPPE
jgi:hypothetical protein